MKSILSAIIIFLFVSILTSCYSEQAESSGEDIILTAAFTDAASTSDTTYPTTTTTTVRTSITKATTNVTTQVSTVSLPDYNSVEMSMLEGIGDPNYNGQAAIPYVAWTEVNLDKIMYPVCQCIGYEFALPDAAAKMKYDAGISLEVIARTSTGYYRIKGDYYIPCDFLDTIVHEGIDAAAATSCTIYTPPEISAAPVSSAAQTEITSP